MEPIAGCFEPAGKTEQAIVMNGDHRIIGHDIDFTIATGKLDKAEAFGPGTIRTTTEAVGKKTIALATTAGAFVEGGITRTELGLRSLQTDEGDEDGK